MRARELGIRTDIVISELKKESSLYFINREYFNSHDNIKIHIKIDEMQRYYNNKGHQIWLWWAIDHATGKVIAYWFGTQEHKNLDKLIETLRS